MKPDFSLLKGHLREILQVAKALGVRVSPNGGYGFLQDTEDELLTPEMWKVCLIGAIQTVAGDDLGLGLNFDERLSLESGFCGWKDAMLKTRRQKALYELGQDLAKEVTS